MLLLTKPEYDLLFEAFTKLATLTTDGRASVGFSVPGSKFEVSSPLVVQITEALSTLGEDFNKQGLTKVPAGRKPLRAFEQYLKHQLYSLTMSILPEYDKRVTNAPSAAAKERLYIYITKVKSRIDLVTGLIKKVEKELTK